MAIITDEREERRRIFRRLAPSFGKILPSAFFQRTPAHQADLPTIHPLIEGIYKPAWSRYVLSIACMLRSPYADQVDYNPDHSWSMRYSPKSGSMDLAQNAALMLCIADHEPVLVLRQVGDKTSAGGARHRLLGLGNVESFDKGHHVFRIRGLRFDETQAILQTGLPDDLLPS